MKRLFSLTLIFSMILSWVLDTQIYGETMPLGDNIYNVSVSFDNKDVDIKNKGKLTYRGYDTENIKDLLDRSEVFKTVKYRNYVSAKKASSFDKHLKLENVKYLYYYLQHNTINYYTTAIEIQPASVTHDRFNEAFIYAPNDPIDNKNYESIFIDRAKASQISISNNTGIDGETKSVYDGNTYYSINNYRPSSVMINENTYNYILDKNSTPFNWLYTYTAYQEKYQKLNGWEAHNREYYRRENPKLFVSAEKITPKTVFYDTGDFNNNQYIPYNRTEYKEASKFWGYLKIQDNSDYKFRLVTKDHAVGYITVDGKTDKFSNKNTYSLKNNKYYPIHLEYIYNDFLGGNFTMEYQKENGAWTQVPSDWLYPGKTTEPEEAEGIFTRKNDLDIKIIDEDSGSEVPMENIPLTITNSQDLPITSADAKTDIDGKYKFNNLNIGDYTISVNAPEGYKLKRQYIGTNDDQSKKVIIYLTKERWVSESSKVEPNDVDLVNGGQLNYRGYDTKNITNWDDRKDVFKSILYRDYLTTTKADSFDKHLKLEDLKYLYYYTVRDKYCYYTVAWDTPQPANMYFKRFPEAYMYSPNDPINNTNYTSSFIDTGNASNISIYGNTGINRQTKAVYDGNTYYSTSNYQPSAVSINEKLYNYYPDQYSTPFSYFYDWNTGYSKRWEKLNFWGAHNTIYRRRENPKLFISSQKIIPKTVFYDKGDFNNNLYIPYNRSEHKEASKFWGYMKLPEKANYKFRVATDTNDIVTYLSDRNWVSATNGSGNNVQKNKNILGNPINLDGQTYEKGIGTHANSTIVYDLGGEYERFKSTIGLDDGANGGSITFSVYADGNEIYRSGEFRQDTKSQEIDLDVSGIKELKLVVDQADYSTAWDIANWADARLIISNNNKASGYITLNDKTESFSFDKSYSLNSNDYYPIQIEYLYNTPNGGGLKMEYQRTDGVWAEVPADWLYPSKDSTPENGDKIFSGNNSSIRVKVLSLDSNNPISNISVLVIEDAGNQKMSSQGAVTNQNGEYFIDNIPPSDYTAFIKPPKGYAVDKTVVKDENIIFYLTGEKLIENPHFKNPIDGSTTSIDVVKGSEVKLNLNVDVIKDAKNVEYVIEKPDEITNLVVGEVFKGTESIGQAVLDGNVIRIPNKVLSEGTYTVKLNMKLSDTAQVNQGYPIKVTQINATDPILNENRTYNETAIFNINSIEPGDLFENLHFKSPINQSTTSIDAIKGTEIILDLNVDITREVENVEYVIEKPEELTNLVVGEVFNGTEGIGQAVLDGNIIRLPKKVLSKGTYTVKLTIKLSNTAKENQVYPVKVIHINAKDPILNENKIYNESAIFNINSVELPTIT